MRIPARILAPILLAVICSGLIVGFLWWQLMQSAQMLRREESPERNPGSLPGETLSDLPVDPRDRSLLALREGDLFALRGEWAEAERAYGEAVELKGGLPALRKLVQAQLQRRDYAAVRSTIRKLRSAGSRPEDVLLLESILELRSGELVKARSILEGAQDSPQKHYGLALLGIVQGNHDQARTELTLVTNGWEPVLRQNARILQAAYDEFSLFPESPNSHLITLLSRALAQVQECELALPLLIQVTQRTTDYRDAWIVQGYCELITERPEQALISLEQAYTLDPEKPEIQFFLGKTYASLDEHQNAITFLEYALQNGFEPPSEIRRLIAEQAVALGNTDLALTQYEALTEDPQARLEAYEGYVEAVQAMGRKEEALAKAEEAVKRFPENPKAHELLGSIAIALERWEIARPALTRALDVNPYSLRAKELLKRIPE